MSDFRDSDVRSPTSDLRHRFSDLRPLISVVIPTYNRAQMICEALDSVKAQTYCPIEIIVVDDGSGDDTGAIVEQWAETEGGGLRSEDGGRSTSSGLGSRGELSVRYVKQENLGGNAARNRGIQEAAGEFVAFLDSDDRWHADKLAKQVAVLESDPQLGAVYCGLQNWIADEDRIEPPAPRRYPSGDIQTEMLIHDVTAPTSCYLVKKTVLNEVGLFDEELQARQDWDMWIRVAAHCHIGAVPEVLVDYRQHSGVRTASDPEKEIRAYCAIMEKYADLRERRSLGVRQAAKSSFYRRMGRVYFHHRISIPKAIGYQLLAIGSWPFVFDSYAALLGMLMPHRVRQAVHRAWNRVFGATPLAIKSH